MKTIRKILFKPEWMLGILLAVVSFAVILSHPNKDSSDSMWSPLVKGQQISFTPNGYDIVYVIDNSRSMLKNDPDGAGKKAFEKITSLAMDYDTSIGVVFFDQNAYTALDLTQLDSSDTAQKVTDILTSFQEDSVKGMGTDISVGLEAAYNMLKPSEPDREKRIILFSDGFNDSSSAPMRNEYDMKLQVIADKLEAKNIVLYGMFRNLNQASINETPAFYHLFVNQTEKASHIIDISDENTEEYISTIVNQFFEVLIDKADRISLKSFSKAETDDNENNTLSLYVPECGITRMEIFIEDVNPLEIEFTSLGCSKSFTSNTEKTALHSYEDPSPGIWTISYKDKNILNEGKCTVSFVTDINCRIQLIDNNGLYHFVFHFYDSQGNELSIDSNISLSAQIRNENGGIVAIPDVTNRKGIYYSDGFTIPDEFKETGIIEFALEYADYLKINYTIDVPVRNYSITGISNKRYYGRKQSEGIAISIPLQEICDSAGVTTIKLLEKNTENMVAASIQEQNIEIIVSKKGLFQGELFLGDSTGIESVISVKGTALTTKSIWVTIVVVLASLLLLIGTILILQQRQKYNEHQK